MKTLCKNCGCDLSDGGAHFDSSLPSTAFDDETTWARCDFCYELACIITRKKFGFPEMFVEVTRVLENYPYLPKRSHPLDVIYREFDLMIQRLAQKNSELREARSIGSKKQRQAMLLAAKEYAAPEALANIFRAMTLSGAMPHQMFVVLSNLETDAEFLSNRKEKA